MNHKRPLVLNLIIVYLIIQIAFAFILTFTGFGIFIGLGTILGIFGVYYGLWNMKKDWMYLVVFLLCAGTIVNIFNTLTKDSFGIIDVALNLVVIYWLLVNRKIFAEPGKGKSAIGTKSEWIRLVLIMIGIAGIPFITVSLNPDYFMYSLVGIVVWSIFIWFFIPKIIGQKK